MFCGFVHSCNTISQERLEGVFSNLVSNGMTMNFWWLKVKGQGHSGFYEPTPLFTFSD